MLVVDVIFPVCSDDYLHAHSSEQGDVTDVSPIYPSTDATVHGYYDESYGYTEQPATEGNPNSALSNFVEKIIFGKYLIRYDKIFIRCMNSV